MIFKEVIFHLSIFIQRYAVLGLLLSPAPDDHVAIIEVNDLIVDDGHHRILCAFIQQVSLYIIKCTTGVLSFSDS